MRSPISAKHICIILSLSISACTTLQETITSPDDHAGFKASRQLTVNDKGLAFSLERGEPESFAKSFSEVLRDQDFTETPENPKAAATSQCLPEISYNSTQGGRFALGLGAIGHFASLGKFKFPISYQFCIERGEPYFEDGLSLVKIPMRVVKHEGLYRDSWRAQTVTEAAPYAYLERELSGWGQFAPHKIPAEPSG